MSTVEILNKNECCGCSGCSQKCPVQAITMVEDKEGFFYPVIDKEKCIDCGLCAKVCPQLKEVKTAEQGFPKAYAMYNKNEKDLLKSSSGGIFSALANYVFEKGGTVFGAVYDEEFNVIHTSVNNREELDKLRKSKYVQSNINNTFREAEKILKDNRIVLFSGTPCQINGLKKYLIKDYENLITCDIVCHGVPSQKAFKKYINYMEKKYDKVVSYDFRCKDKPDYEKIGKIKFSNSKCKYLKIGTDCYYNNFLTGNLFRESCYTCKYANMNRVGDITIGDFLGVNEVQAEAKNRNGISICIINNDKGNKIIEEIKDTVEIKDTTTEKIKKFNSNLHTPVDRPRARNTIYENINDTELFIKDLKNSMSKKMKYKSLIPIKLKIFLKKCKGKLK